MKFTKIHSPIRKSPGYYDCLNEIKTPVDTKDTYTAMIVKERNDADMARQAAKANSEDEDWVMVINDIPCNKGWAK